MGKLLVCPFQLINFVLLNVGIGGSYQVAHTVEDVTAAMSFSAAPPFGPK
jgi:hypothetical protein